MKSTKEDFVKGKKVEERFRSLFSEMKESTHYEDMHDKFDAKIEIRFDIKGKKKVNRFDSEPSQNWHWIELKSVSGTSGWLYSKETDFFVFEIDDYWVMVDKIKLQELVAKKVKKDVRGKNPYGLYNRKNRLDVLTLFPTVDIMAIAEDFIRKEDED